MQIDQHLKAVIRTPLPAHLQIPEAVFLRSSILFFKKHIVHRDPDMVKSKRCDIFDVIFGDESVKMLFAVSIKLGDPSSEIDALLKSFKLSHTDPLRFPLISVSSRIPSIVSCCDLL